MYAIRSYYVKLSIRHLAVTLSLSCILFQSSYAAIDRMELVQRHNVQTFSIDPEARITSYNVCYTKLLRISDALNHASIIDGIRLCKAKRFRYANNDMADLERKLQEADSAGARFKMIATDGVFSMDGIVADLRNNFV